MGDRRRTNRFVVPAAAEAVLRLMQDVYLERQREHDIIVLSDRPVPAEERLVLELSGEDSADSRRTLDVKVVGSQRLTTGRHRVVLEIETGASTPATRFAPMPSIGVVIRQLEAHIRDISVSGCLLETADPLDEGAIGVLELCVNGERHTETLRVCRSFRAPGARWPFRSGARFLALNAPPGTSVRNVVARFELLDELNAMPEALARVHRRGTIGFVTRERYAWSDADTADWHFRPRSS